MRQVFYVIAYDDKARGWYELLLAHARGSNPSKALTDPECEEYYYTGYEKTTAGVPGDPNWRFKTVKCFELIWDLATPIAAKDLVEEVSPPIEGPKNAISIPRNAK